MEKITMNECAESLYALTQYLREKGQGHNHYKMYSNMERISKIREKKELILSRGDNWNDKNDRNRFNLPEQDYVNYGRCFSFSLEESVAMWMLYGGNKKQGGLIDFTKKGVQSILQVSKIEAGISDKNHKFISVATIERPHFSINMTDVLYYSKKGGAYYVRRGDEVIRDLSSTIFDGLVGCTKAYPWQYENECRLIVSVPRTEISKECTLIRIDLSNLDMGKSFERIYRSPNYVGVIPEYSMESTLEGSIDWDCCKGCTYRK